MPRRSRGRAADQSRRSRHLHARHAHSMATSPLMNSRTTKIPRGCGPRRDPWPHGVTGSCGSSPRRTVRLVDSTSYARPSPGVGHFIESPSMTQRETAYPSTVPRSSLSSVAMSVCSQRRISVSFSTLTCNTSRANWSTVRGCGLPRVCPTWRALRTSPASTSHARSTFQRLWTSPCTETSRGSHLQ